MPSFRFVTALATLARTGIIAGVALAALLYPLVAMGGFGVKAGAKQITGELESLKVAPLSQVSKVYASDGKTLITQFYEEYRIPVPMESISPHVANAIVASEDSRFYEHNGVDMRGIARAFVANQQAGEVSQGASTITMQYVRMSLRDAAQTPTDGVDVPAALNDWGFFCDFFKKWWIGRTEYGASPLERLDKLRRGGYVVVTTLDARAQA